MVWVLIIGGVLVMAAIFLVVPGLILRSMAPELQRRVAAVYQPAEVVFQDLRALSFGQQSRGVLQARGNGALVLTARELHFFQYLPDRQLRIPLDAITGVKTTRSHLGKTIARKLLHVSFTVDGKPDSVAWYVPDLDGWLSRLPKPAAQATA